VRAGSVNNTSVIAPYLPASKIASHKFLPLKEKSCRISGGSFLFIIVFIKLSLPYFDINFGSTKIILLIFYQNT